MKTTAIYTVRQYGQDSHFYSYCAGGFSYPFLVMERLTRADAALNRNQPEDQKLSVAVLLPEIRGDSNFPEAAKGLRIFRAIRESEAAAHLDRTSENERIPFHITLDLDQDTVGFAFNRDCPNLDLPDLAVPMVAGQEGLSGRALAAYAAQEQATYTQMIGTPHIAELNEQVYEDLIRSFVAELTRSSDEEPVGGMVLK